MKNLLLIITIALLYSCKLADVRPELVKGKLSDSDEEKGLSLLKQSIEAMGYNNFESISTVETTMTFDWRFPWSSMPLHSFPGARNKPMRLLLEVGSFNGQSRYLSGRKKDAVFGLQSWESYRQLPGKELELKKDPRRSWGLATFHYILETPYRLLSADVITYAGTKEFEGQQYDLVYVTWKDPKPHKAHDQWLIYINQDTKHVDLCHLTIRDFFMPFPPNMAMGTVRFLNREETEPGIKLPTEIVIQLLNPKKAKKHLYKLTFEDYRFDTRPPEDLKPFPELKVYGDSKPDAK
ncbi:MAG: hypothetical protein AAFQ94_17445 [Bacteroidota bacterium]